MKTRMLITLAALAALAAFAAPAPAQVVYDNGAPDGGAGSVLFNEFAAADDFGVAGTLAFNTVVFWGLLPTGTSYTPSLFWQLLQDDGGLPGATVVASGNATPTAELRGPLGSTPPVSSWRFTFGVGAQSLGTGVYWLALHDDGAGQDLISETTASQSGEGFAQSFLDVWARGGDADLAFQLVNETAVVPEPASLLLLGSGLVGLAAARRRRSAPGARPRSPAS